MSDTTRNTVIAATATIAAALITVAGYVVLQPDEKVDGPKVSAVSLSAKVTEFNSACPITLRFDGRIEVDGGTGALVYRFLYVDGVGVPSTEGERRQVSVDGASTVKVSDEWTPTIPQGRVFRTATLELLEPTNLKSAPITIRGTCDASLPPGPDEPPPDVGPPS